MKLTQRHFADSVEVDLRDEEFEYTLKSSGTKKRFTVDYLNFQPSILEETEEASTWWRNVGIAWVLLGSIFTVLRFTEGEGLRISFWFYLGLACLAVYRFSRTSFTHHAIDGGGRVVFIKNRAATSILEELSSRRRERLAKVYGEIDFDEDPDREVAKFKWLEAQGALSSEEAAARIFAVRSADEGTDEPETLGVN